MKIRNLQEYLKALCSKPFDNSISYLYGENKDQEPLLYEILGRDGSVDSMVENCANFAKNTEEQVFYEFVQNALDADADSVSFYLGKVDEQGYLLVLNNGKPFYTDTPKTDNVKLREGQFFKFLNKGKSDKPNEPTLGKFGKGSKLLYGLLVDNNASVSLERLIVPSIIGQRKSPYLLSWSDGYQLDNFLLDKNQWDRSCGYDNEEFLIAKILCCYYPIEPNVDETLFSSVEVSTLVKVFEQLVKPSREITRWQKSGTAIIIPLGKGKFEILENKGKLQKIESCLKPFPSIITGYAIELRGKQLTHIVLMGKDILPLNPDFITVELTHQIPDKKNGALSNKIFKYQFLFDKAFTDNSTVNLYSALPISNTSYNLGYIVDSLDLPIDDSRQNINDIPVAKSNLKDAFFKLTVELQTILKNDKPQFERIYYSLLQSRPNNEIVKEPFEAVIKPFLKDNVQDIDGMYHKSEVSVYINTKFQIPLSDIGITDIFQVSETVYENYKGLNLTIIVCSLSDIINKSDVRKFADWILSLDDTTYQEYHHEVLKIINSHSTRPLLRTNKGRCVSWNDVVGSSNVYFKDNIESRLLLCNEIEYVLHPLGMPITNSFNPKTILWRKIKENQHLYSSEEAVKFACSALKDVYSSSTNLRGEIRRDFKVLKSIKGQNLALQDLFYQRPENTCLYNDYVLQSIYSQYVDATWFVQENERYYWIVRHWKQIIEFTDWQECSSQYIKDITDVWNNYKGNDKKRLFLYLSDNGVPEEKDQKYIKGTENLSENNYNVLTALYSRLISDCRFVPYRYHKILTTTPFELGKLEFSDLLDNTHTSRKLSLNELRILLKAESSVSFWKNFKVKDDEPGYYNVSKLDGGKNYGMPEDLDENVIILLEKAKIYRIPKSMDEHTQDITLEQNLCNSIDATKNCKELGKCSFLLPLVKLCPTRNVLSKFAQNLEELEFIKEERVDSTDIRWQIIKWFTSSNLDEVLPNRSNIIWEKIKYNDKILNNTLPPNKVETDNWKYRLFDLFPRYKQEDDDLESLKELLPDADLFENKYCKHKRQVISSEEVYSQMDKSKLNLYQLEFALDYVSHKPLNSKCLKLNENIGISEALDMILRRKYKDFYRAFDVDSCLSNQYKDQNYYFNPDKQVYVDGEYEEYLLECEKVPSPIVSWIKEQEKKHEIEQGKHPNEILTILFTNCLFYNHPLIRFRKELKQRTKATKIDLLEENAYWLLKNTNTWICDMQSQGIIRFEYNQKNMIEAVEDILCPLAKNEDLYLFKYPSAISDGDNFEYEFTKVTNTSSIYFMKIDGGEKREKETLESIKRGLKNAIPELCSFFKDKCIIRNIKDEDKRKHSLGNKSLIEVYPEFADNETSKEWDDETYKKWKTKPELSKGICIFTSKREIRTVLKFKTSDGAAIPDIPTSKDSNYGYKKDTNNKLCLVTVLFPNGEDVNIYKALENRVVPEVAEFREPFIALQGLKLAEFDNVDVDKAKLANDIEKDLLEVITSLSPEEKEKIKRREFGIGNGDGAGTGGGYIHYQDKEEEEKEPKINPISGYIGECLYNTYLTKIVKLSNVNWVADELNDESGGAYDFRIGELYVEVKTNVYTIKDGTSPFYLHRSQMKFLHEHDTEKYYICRLSLSDLGLLQDRYRRLRENWKDTDPRKEPRLKEECDRIVEKYWERSDSKETFENTRWLYKMKDILNIQIKNNGVNI